MQCDKPKVPKSAEFLLQNDRKMSNFPVKIEFLRIKRNRSDLQLYVEQNNFKYPK